MRRSPEQYTSDPEMLALVREHLGEAPSPADAAVANETTDTVITQQTPQGSVKLCDRRMTMDEAIARVEALAGAAPAAFVIVQAERTVGLYR